MDSPYLWVALCCMDTCLSVSARSIIVFICGQPLKESACLWHWSTGALSVGCGE